MAVTITKDLTDLYSAEANTGWTGSDSVTPYTGWQREGTNCLGFQGSQGTEWAYKTITSTNLSSTHIYSWMSMNGSPDTLANGGYRIVVGDGTNRIAYYVGGSDSLGFSIGAWSCFVLDTANPPSSFAVLAGAEASLNFSAVTQIGVGFDIINKAVGSVDNIFWDIARYGNGLIIGGGGVGTEGSFAEIAADDALISAGKAYGIVRELQTGVYGVQGQLKFGDNTNTTSTYFDDEDTIVIFENNAVAATHYKLSVVGNSTGTNSFVLGNKVGTGDTAIGANGCTIQSAGPSVAIDLSAANTNIIKIYGTKFLGIGGGIALNTNTAHEFIGNIIDQSGQVDPKQTIIRNCTFSGTTDNSNDGSAMLWNTTINIKNCSFNANTDSVNDPHGVEHTVAETVSYDNLTFLANDYDIHFTPASGNLIVNAMNGANPGTSEKVGSGSVTINNAVALKVYAKDTSNNALAGIRVGIYKSSDDTELMNEETVAITGLAEQSYNYLASTPIYVRIRRSSATGTRYYPISTTGTITSTGYTLTAVLTEDGIVA